MAFTIIGTLNGRTCSVVWDDGEFTGDPTVLKRINASISAGASLPLIGAGPYFVASADDVEAAYVTAINAFARVTDESGTIPKIEIPELPPDAIPGSGSV